VIPHECSICIAYNETVYTLLRKYYIVIMACLGLKVDETDGEDWNWTSAQLSVFRSNSRLRNFCLQQ
jgi:hypothetical protein